MFVSCTVFVLSGRGLCNGPIPGPEEANRVWCVLECDQVKIKTLSTHCEQLGRRGKDYKTKNIKALCWYSDLLDGLEFERCWGQDFPYPSGPASKPTQPCVQWVLGVFPRGEVAGAWC
jgi:hypothetical protein